MYLFLSLVIFWDRLRFLEFRMIFRYFPKSCEIFGVAVGWFEIIGYLSRCFAIFGDPLRFLRFFLVVFWNLWLFFKICWDPCLPFEILWDPLRRFFKMLGDSLWLNMDIDSDWIQSILDMNIRIILEIIKYGYWRWIWNIADYWILADFSLLVIRVIEWIWKKRNQNRKWVGDNRDIDSLIEES